MKKRSLGIALAAIALGAVTTVPASADAAGNTIIEIKSVAYGTCAEPGGKDKSNVVLAACDGSADQQWERASAGADNAAVLRNVATGKCVINFGMLTPWHCDVERLDEIIQFIPAGDGKLRLKFSDGDEYADTWLVETGGAVATRGFAEFDHQLWQVRTVGQTAPVDTAGKAVRFTSHYRDLCVGAGGMDIQLMPCADAPEQWFQRVELGDGSFQLRNEAKGVCLSAATYWADLDRACDANDATQKWRLDTDGFGLSLVRASNNKVLSIGPSGNYISLSEPVAKYKYADKFELSAR